MTVKPLISIIIPVYKVESYIKECVNSILNQTYKNLEIILVDDGSPDNCGDICDDYALKNTRIKVIHKENGGLSDARNIGLDIATGEYISFIDSDDIIHPQFIEILLKLIIDSNSSISFCNSLMFMKTEELNHNKIIKDNVNYEIFSSYNMVKLLCSPKYRSNTTIICNKLYHKNIFKNLRFTKGVIYEDAHIFTDIYYNTNLKIAYTDNPLYLIRKNPESLSRGIYTIEHWYSWRAFCYKRLELFKDNKKLYKYAIREYSECLLTTYLKGFTKEVQKELSIKKLIYIFSNNQIHWKSRLLFLIKLIGNSL